MKFTRLRPPWEKAEANHTETTPSSLLPVLEALPNQAFPQESLLGKLLPNTRIERSGWAPAGVLNG